MNYLNNIETNQVIKETLIKACIKSRPSYFKPYLFSDKVTCDSPDKEAFYKCLKYIIAASKQRSEGALYLKIKFPDPDNISIQRYEFYDSVHLHSRLTIIIEEINDTIHLAILPF